MDSSLTAGLLLITLAGGYIFSILFFPSRIAAAREDGHRLYFRSAFYSLPLFIWSFLILLWAYSHGAPVFSENFLEDCSPNTERTITIFSFLKLSNCAKAQPSTLIAVSSFSLFLAPIIAWLLNLVLRLPILQVEGQNWVLRSWKNIITQNISQNDELEKLIYESVYRTGLPLMLTLEDGKVYIGWTGLDFDWKATKENNNFLRILPLVSGHRDPTTHEFVPKTFYQDMYDLCDPENPESRQPNDFEIVIPSSRLISAHQFDLALYAEYMDQLEDTEESTE